MIMNSIGCFLRIVYIVIFIVYAPENTKRVTWVQILVLIVIVPSVFLPTFLLASPRQQVSILGWVSVLVAVAVFAAPLGVMRLVIQTQSVEFMPFAPSLCMTLSAVMWFFYGLALQDYFIAIPNILGFFLGVFQIVMYARYHK